MAAQDALNRAPFGRTLLRHAATSMLDQAWLSALNLALGLLLIRLASADAYGTYALLFAGGILATVIAEASMLNPLTTLACGLPAPQRKDMIAHVNRLHARLGLGLALAFGLAALALLLACGAAMPGWLAAAYGAYVYTAVRREFQRNTGFLEGRPADVLRADLSCGVILVCAAGLLAFSGRLNLPLLMGAMALANCWPLWRGPRPPRPADPADAAAHLARLWQRGRLGLPGAASSWIVNYSYLYVVAAWLGTAATAELNASRLLLMPVSLAAVAWTRVARPMASRLAAARELRPLSRLALASIAGLELLTLAYAAALWQLLPWLQEWLFGAQYPHMDSLIGWWTLYFLLYAARWAGGSLLLSADAYRPLLSVALSSLGLLLAILPPGLAWLGTTGAIGALAIVEAYGLLAIWFFFIPAAYRRLSASRP